MALKKIIIGPCSPLGIIGASTRAKIVYSGSSTYTSELTGTGSTITTTLRTDILTKSGDRYIKGWTTTSGSTTINYNRGASVTLTDGQTLTIYPVYYADAKIVYSGANRKVTNGTTYTQTVHATSTGSYSATLNKTYFRKLYNKATFKGWTKTNSTSATVTQNYSDGATVSLTEGQTLTIYPIYNKNTTSLTLGQTSNLDVNSTTTNKTYTFTTSSYISGYTAGDPYTINIYGYVSDHNNGTSSNVKVSLAGASATTVCNGKGTASSTNSATITSATKTAASMSVKFTFYSSKHSEFKGYVSGVTIW
jgi:hypothetical protein